MTYRVMFADLTAAVEGLLTVLEDARETSDDYSFGPLSASAIYASGLLVIGEAPGLAKKLDALEGTTRYTE